jgi:hypothetical protein
MVLPLKMPQNQSLCAECRVKLSTAAMVDRLIGVVCLTYTLQMHLGQRVSVAPRGQQRRVQWTVTDRVSWFWGGQWLFDDPGYEWMGEPRAASGCCSSHV